MHLMVLCNKYIQIERLNTKCMSLVRAPPYVRTERMKRRGENLKYQHFQAGTFATGMFALQITFSEFGVFEVFGYLLPVVTRAPTLLRICNKIQFAIIIEFNN